MHISLNIYFFRIKNITPSNY